MRGIGFIAVAAAAGAQVFVGLSHQYFVEPLQCLAVVWAVLVALRCRKWPRSRTLIHLASSTLLGMLAKASTPLYSLLPTAFILLSLARSQQPWDFNAEWRRRTSRALVYGFIASGTFGAIWYIRNYAAVLQHIRDATSGEIALTYGFRAPLGQKFLLWLRFLGQGFLEPYLFWILGFLVLVSGIAIFAARVPFSQCRRQTLIFTLSVIQIALVLFAFARGDVVEPRYLSALLPYVTAVIIILCSLARYRAVQVLVLAGCLTQWMTVNRASFELTPVLGNQFPWLLPIVTDSTAHREVSELIRRTSVFSGYNIVAIEEPQLNANTAAFFAAKNRLTTGVRAYYTGLGYAQKDSSAAMNRIEELSARFVISLDEPFQPSPNFLNLVSLAVLRQVRSSGRFAPVPFPSQKGILIFERQSRGPVAATRP
jgi:hypothetical protein